MDFNYLLASPACRIVFSVAILMLSGCGANEDQAFDATGHATLDGKPLEMGVVFLAPMEGGEHKSSDLRKNGEFTVYSIRPGDYQVAINTSMYANMAASRARPTGGKAITMREIEGTFRPVPRKFEQVKTSGIVVHVQQGEVFEVNLSSTNNEASPPSNALAD